MSRRGFTLTELLVVMGMAGVILTVGMGMLHRVMHEQKFADRENVMHRVAERLSSTLREDIHLASSAEIIHPGDDGERRLVLSRPDESTVTYVVRKNVLERTSIEKNERSHRDSFQFPDNYRLEFSNDPSHGVSFAAFAVPQAYLATASDKAQSVVSETDVRRAVMRVEAKVGRNHRFLSATKEGRGEP